MDKTDKKIELYSEEVGQITQQFIGRQLDDYTLSELKGIFLAYLHNLNDLRSIQSIPQVTIQKDGNDSIVVKFDTISVIDWLLAKREDSNGN